MIFMSDEQNTPVPVGTGQTQSGTQTPQPQTPQPPLSGGQTDSGPIRQAQGKQAGMTQGQGTQTPQPQTPQPPLSGGQGADSGQAGMTPVPFGTGQAQSASHQSLRSDAGQGTQTPQPQTPLNPPLARGEEKNEGQQGQTLTASKGSDPVTTDPVATGSTGAQTTEEEKFEIPEVVSEKYPDLIPLVKGSAAMDHGEKQYWFSLLPVMTEPQVEKLRDILTRERERMGKIDQRYNEEMNLLQQKKLDEWKAYRRQKDTEARKEKEEQTKQAEQKEEVATLEELEKA